MNTEIPGSEGQQPNPADAAVDATQTNDKAQDSTEGQAADGSGQGGENATATDDGQKPEGDGQKDDTAAAGAPESYADFTLPEGYELTGERLEQAQAMFKDLNLTQEQAQKLVDRYVTLDGENATARQKLLDDAREQKIEQWGNESRAELKDQYDSTVESARYAVQTINDPALKEAFDKEGWGNHPSLIKAFSFFGKMLQENPMDGLGGNNQRGRTSTGDPEQDRANRMYPNQK
jgi:hypothetical protein